MLAVDYSTVKNHLKDYCKRAADDYETVIVTRKKEKNVVLMSLEKYNQIMRAAANADYSQVTVRGVSQLAAGNSLRDELLAAEDEE